MGGGVRVVTGAEADFFPGLKLFSEEQVDLPGEVIEQGHAGQIRLSQWAITEGRSRPVNRPVGLGFLSLAAQPVCI